jgi:hypothetical protein
MPPSGVAIPCSRVNRLEVIGDIVQRPTEAATLQLPGFARATDVIGGFNVWVAAGLPLEPA